MAPAGDGAPAPPVVVQVGSWELAPELLESMRSEYERLKAQGARAAPRSSCARSRSAHVRRLRE